MLKITFQAGEIMARAELIENLNKALSLELAGVIQYSQHSYLVTGIEREIYRGFFRDQSEEAQKHALFLGDKLVALGGVPTVEPAMIRQSTDLSEMLRQEFGARTRSVSRLYDCLGFVRRRRFADEILARRANCRRTAARRGT
jgi:bacterioferritin (cytochrome b1)